MYKKQNSLENFNPLYLDEYESFTWKLNNSVLIFIDPITEKESILSGSLYINSKSLIFQPENSLSPILKFRFRHFLQNSPSTFQKQQNNYLQIKTTEITEIRRDGPPQKYINHYNKNIQNEQILFKFQKNKTLEFVIEIQDWIQSLLNILMQEHLLDNPIYFVIKLMISKNPNFLQIINIDTSNESLILSNMLVCRILPMTEQWGFLYLTNKHFYFQELIWTDKINLVKIPISKIKTLLKRRYEMEFNAVEIFTKKQDFYFNFKNTEDRNFFYVNTRKLCSKDVLTEKSLPKLTQKWVQRQISNFDYLIFLNELAHRSFNDLTQYPVFPWILKDYDSTQLNLDDTSIYRDLSKPIGALNKQRLQEFKEKYDQLPDDNKFLYGSHYSSPGYVIGYLLRKEPLYMLKIQSGKYDIADRLFHSIKEEWGKCYNHIGCVKELIPEFFMDQSDFLINKKHVKFGIRQDGQVVDKVILPNWAKDEQDFLKKHREIFESDYVSANLHQWIDLIFGYKQRGKIALEADNLFLNTSYEGFVDLDKINDPTKKRGLKTQINEYGQTPKQLFKEPHQQRNSKSLIELNQKKKSSCFNNEERSKESYQSFTNDQIFQNLVIEKKREKNLNIPNCKFIQFVPKLNQIVVLSNEVFLKYFDYSTLENTKTLILGKNKIELLQFIPTNQLVFTQNNYLNFLDLETGQNFFQNIAHQEEITSLKYFSNKLSKQNYVFTSSKDSSIKLWKMSDLKNPIIIDEDLEYYTLQLEILFDNNLYLVSLDQAYFINIYQIEPQIKQKTLIDTKILNLLKQC